MKRCLKCNEDKEYHFFHKDKSRKDGLFPYCKKCRGVITPNEDRKPYLPNKDKRYFKYMGRYYHRYLMEQKIGRRLKKNEVVHHIDGNKHNNKIENLELIKDKKHRQNHYRELRHKLKPKISKCICSICKNNFRAKQKYAKYCSPKCIYISRKSYLKKWIINAKQTRRKTR